MSILRGCISLSDKASSLLVKSDPRDITLCNAPHAESTMARSAALVGHFRVRLGAFGTLSRRRLTLHLPLRILGRSRRFTACTIHRAGQRVLIGISR
ncbi:hypothetical protein [Bradyrhizobium vignae]|uniref:hypothetical protein n=1 Tax=Bradyrhizobium vignae TaxID=1549949 RepID=UPI0013E8DA29|nr:hypothetical protein [Bradyrhizobium vignae]